MHQSAHDVPAALCSFYGPQTFLQDLVLRLDVPTTTGVSRKSYPMSAFGVTATATVRCAYGTTRCACALSRPRHQTGAAIQSRLRWSRRLPRRPQRARCVRPPARSRGARTSAAVARTVALFTGKSQSARMQHQRSRYRRRRRRQLLRTSTPCWRQCPTSASQNRRRSCRRTSSRSIGCLDAAAGSNSPSRTCTRSTSTRTRSRNDLPSDVIDTTVRVASATHFLNSFDQEH